jgi:hypothetical protein
MADCHKLFTDYNKDLNIKKTKRDSLKESKDILRTRIKNYFKENHPLYNPLFFIQGSYKMETMIRTKDDECDLDDGVYFKREPDVTATTLQKWVYNAVEGHTTGGQQHRKKCIRVIYAGDYHIDIPVYYQLQDADGNDEHPMLAVKNGDFEESDPKEFIEWYKDIKTEQMVRVSRYLKGWGDFKRNNMPSGLAMTVLTEKNFELDDRDDIALRDTLKEIKNDLKNDWECVMPTTPKDDLFADKDKTFKDNFFTALDSFIEDADAAINEECQEKASKMWRKHLGERFPLGESKEAKEAKSVAAAEKAGSLLISVQGKPKEEGITGKSKGGSYGEN